MNPTAFAPRPHEEAARLIAGKSIVTREVFDGLLPELRARAFTIAGIEGADILQRVRDRIADLPRGGETGTWDKVKADVVDELSPYLGDGAEKRAELLIRTHGFQAFQASNWRVAQEDADTTHLQYLATEDDRVRDSHLALNGLVLPKDDPFWDNHFPPWDWGCRCRVRPMNPDLVEEARMEDEQKDPGEKLVLEGPALKALRNGQILRGAGDETKSFDVLPPEGAGAFRFHPDNFNLTASELEKTIDPTEWIPFKRWALLTKISPGLSVWQWLARAG